LPQVESHAEIEIKAADEVKKIIPGLPDDVLQQLMKWKNTYKVPDQEDRPSSRKSSF
jgi:hypothetical protein